MTITPRIRFQVFHRDNFTCRYCGRHGNESQLEVDHVVPRSKGGKDHIENLATACIACNRGKGALNVGPGQSFTGPRGGLFCHILRPDRSINNQCQVIHDKGDGVYDVQFYSWLDGGPTNRGVVGPLRDDQIVFYPNDHEMRRAYAVEQGWDQAEIEGQEKWIALMNGADNTRGKKVRS